MVAMELLLGGPQPLVRPVFTQHGGAVATVDTMEIDDCADGRERAQSVGSSEGTVYERKDYVEIKYAPGADSAKSPTSGDESRLVSGNYRSFRCSICAKVFCHSSSLSRHRMQAHFKSYKCTLCRKDITSELTLDYPI
ncbi:unnamed protein product [Nippostrongylus brasiliensis]|uniref:C2H2-type domain-containing protein n=1 Tax=Nippostrongylus brasiliensis TaxID=27835 RepID=A0A158R2Z9_NIPBR|nr:unnamed protein product [Nippostrongylus brasiliensis]